MQVKILIGTVAFMLTMIIFGFAALQEPARLARFEAARVGRSVESGAALYEQNCTTCHGVNARAQECYDASSGESIGCIGRALNHAPLVCGDPSKRMDEYQWAGSKFAFVEGTLISGRTANGMPAWSQQVGGPLQRNEIEDLTYFILNFENEELCSVVAFVFPWPGIAEPDPQAYDDYLQITWDDIVIEDDRVEVPDVPLPVTSPGDIDNGRALFTSYGCNGCHGDPEGDRATANVGPWQGDLYELAGTRLDGYSAEQYIYESIVNPAAYIVPDCPNGPCGNAMPNNFGDRMSNSPQDMEDLITYLMSLGN